jgi:uncharacterized protein YegP (UPF0339 family)
MAHARKQAHTNRRRDHQGVDSAPIEFLVFQSNSGDYRWEIASAGGGVLAQSGSFASFEEAGQSARQVRDGAASTRLELQDAGSGTPGGGTLDDPLVR